MKLHPAYLAGLIDAGAYLQRRDRGKWVAWQLRITAPSLEVAQQIVNQFGGTVEEIQGGHRVAWYSRDGIATVLSYAADHVIAKRDEVQSFLDEQK